MARTYTTKNGTQFTLAKISPFLLSALLTYRAETLPAPEKILAIAGTEGKPVPDYGDKHYLQAKKEYEDTRLYAALRGIFCVGVKESVPSDISEYYEHILLASVGRVTGSEHTLMVKYLWIMDQLDDVEDLEGLQNAIISQTMPTEGDISKSLSSFRNDSER